MYKIILISFIISIVSTAAQAEKITLSDKEIHKLMIGSWVTDPKDPEYGPTFGISIYHSDGTLDFTMYKSNECNSVIFNTKATWGIRAKHLNIQVSKSERTDIHKERSVLSDKIIHIDENSMTLKARDGAILYRVRSKTCIKT